MSDEPHLHLGKLRLPVLRRSGLGTVMSCRQWELVAQRLELIAKHIELRFAGRRQVDDGLARFVGAEVRKTAGEIRANMRELAEWPN